MIKHLLKNLFSPKRCYFRHAFALAATAVLATAISYLTLSPPQLSDQSGLLSDKAYHVIAFAALVMPTAVFYARSLVFLVPAAVMFGGAIELVQPYVGRSREGTDFIADILGVGLGLVIGLLIRAAYQRRTRHRTAETT